jgi:hypothetical protein
VLVIIGLLLLAVVVATLEGIRDIRRLHPSFHPRFRDGIGRRVIKTLLTVFLGIPALNFCIQFADTFVVAHSSVDTRAHIFLAIIAAVIGCIGFDLKLRKQHWYGALEVMFGILLAYQSMSNTKASDKLQLALSLQYFAAIYVVIRGLTNVFDGFEIEKKKGFLEGIGEIIGKTVLQGDPSAVSSQKAPQ